MNRIPDSRSVHGQFRLAAWSTALLLGAASVASAQTVIPPELKAPPGSYDASTNAFAIRTHQITTARTPGEQNSIANVERQLKGDFGPGIATPGPAGGYYFREVVDFDVSRINPDFGGVGFMNEPFPGVDLDDMTPSPNYNNSNIVAELIGFLELPAGNVTLTLRSDDSVRLTIGNGANPLDFTAVQPAGAVFDGSRGPANSTFTLSVTSAGVYPIRIVYGQGGGGGTLEFYSTEDYFGTPVNVLVNDPSWLSAGVGLVCHPPASLPISATSAYVSYLQPYPGATGVSPLPELLAQIKDAGTTVNTDGIALAVDNSPVSATVSKSGDLTTVTGSVTNLLSPNSVHTVTLVYQDSTPRSVTNSWSFTVGNFFPVPASYAYPLGSGDATKRGFVGKVHVARANQAFNASIGRANAQLRDELIDFTRTPPAPYLNLVQTPAHPAPSNPNMVNADGTFVNPGVINYSISATPPNDPVEGNGYFFESANGYPNSRYPGLPGWNDATYAIAENINAFAWEELAWIELPQGLVRIGARAYDAVQIAIHRNDPRDIFREAPVWFDSNAGNANRENFLYVQEAGLYGFRIVQTMFGASDCQVEFYTADPVNFANRTLVNDSTVPGAAKAYQALTVPTRPYVTSVSPAIGSSGVPLNAPIQVVLVNLGATVPVLKVDGATVPFSTTTAGNQTTLSYTNTQGWPAAKVVNVSVEYAGAVGAWNFQTQTGLKALVVGLSAGDTLISQRLASKFGLDVSNLPEGTVSAANNLTPEFFSQFKLIWNSEAVASGGSRPYINYMRDNRLPVPVINVEQGNVADWRFGSAGTQTGMNANYASVIITNPASPFAAGLTGTNRLLSVGANGQFHTATGIPETAFGMVGTSLDGMPAVFGFKAGTEGTQGYIHPARRVQFPIAGPSMVVNWNDNAWAMFDAAVNWVLPPRLTIGPAAAGHITISWTGEGVLEESSSLEAGTWTPSASQANPQTRPATGARFFRVKQ